MGHIDLIYCAGANRRLMAIAQDAGWLLGVRSDRQSYGFPVSFVDIDYRRPNWEWHRRRVAKEHPVYATVPDLSETVIDMAEIEVALARADELANDCAVPLLVPKLASQLALIPPQYAVAYSVPSSYGGAQYSPWRLAGRRVHLLGGSPQLQRRIVASLRGIADVLSVDGNMAQKVAMTKLNYWEAGVWKKMPRGAPDSPYHCWAISCRNIVSMWRAEVRGEYASPPMTRGWRRGRVHYPVAWEQASLWVPAS